VVFHRHLNSLEGVSQGSHRPTFEDGEVSMQGDSRRRAGLTMFRTVGIDRTGFDSIPNDDPITGSTSRGALAIINSLLTTRQVRTCRTPFVSTALPPCIYGTSMSLVAPSPGSIIQTGRSHLVHSTTFPGETLGAGPRTRWVPHCEYHGNFHSRLQCQLAWHTFAGHHLDGHH
jgi:hypothetical protein